MNLTILILSYERHEELEKKISYWNYLSSFRYKILIIDGSTKPLKVNLKNKNIKYIHFKSRDYHERIFYSLRFIKTKYIKLESDDDYFLPYSLNESIQFLNKNKNYCAVYGQAGIYSIYKNKIFINHIFKIKQNLNSNDFKTRLKIYFSNYTPKLYYSLMRTSVFKKNVALWKKSKKIYGQKFQRFAEIHLPLTLLLNGKIKVINKLFWIRKDDDIKNRVEFTSNKTILKNDHTYTNISKWFLKNNNLNYFDNFAINLCKITRKKILHKDYILKNILQNYHLKGIRKRMIYNKPAYVFSNFVKILTPSMLKKIIRFNLKINGPEILDGKELKRSFNLNYNVKDIKYLKSVLLKK